jgi:deazaflavin-dependent oxidoreductase (nitroreductase family)
VGARSTGRGWFESRPIGIVLRLYRLPILLYRVNLGWLLGHRSLLLTHRGRKTGLLRQTVLEVIVYDPATRESVVISGYGDRADWYRNITVEPALEAQTGRERYVPAQRFLTPQENVAAIVEYERRHPLPGRIFARIFDYPLGGSEAARRDFARSMRLVAFRPQPRHPAHRQPPLKARP